MAGLGRDADRAARRATRRARGAIAMYNQVFVRLILAAIVTFTAIFLAAYVYVAPFGTRSLRAALPVLDAFMSAGAEGDRLGARLQLSADLLRSDRLAEVEALLADPGRFRGYQGLEGAEFRLLAPVSPGSPELAAVEARVRYEDGVAARLNAVLVLENARWRINDLRLAAGEAGP